MQGGGAAIHEAPAWCSLSDPGLLSHPVRLSTGLHGAARTSRRRPRDVVINTTPPQPHLRVLSPGNCSSRLIIGDDASLKRGLFQGNASTNK